MADAPQNQNQQQFQHQQKPDFAFSKDHPVFPFASMASAATSATDIDDNNGVGAAADEERRGAIPATMMNIEGVRRAPPAVPNLLPSGSGMSSSSSGAAAVSSMISPSEQYQQQQQQQMMDFKV
jgi:hypothetical protein